MQSDAKKRLWTVKDGEERPNFWEVDKNALKNITYHLLLLCIHSCVYWLPH